MDAHDNMKEMGRKCQPVIERLLKETCIPFAGRGEEKCRAGGAGTEHRNHTGLQP